MSMVQLRIDDWLFEINMTRTMAYSAEEAEGHCTCDDCRNFYAAVDDHHPQLRPFLAQFGIDVEAPEQMSPVAISKDRIDYDPSYIVFGRILSHGTFNMAAGKASFVAQADGDRFWLHTYDVSMPWVLDIPFPGGEN